MNLRKRIALQVALLSLVLLVAALLAVYLSNRREAQFAMLQRSEILSDLIGKTYIGELYRSEGASSPELQSILGVLVSDEDNGLLSVEVRNKDDRRIAFAERSYAGAVPRPYSRIILLNRRSHGSIHLVFDAAMSEARARRALAALAGIFLLIAAAGCGVAFLLAGRITRPIARLTAAADRLARGEPGARAEDDTDDEIGTMGRRFNAMAEAIAGAEAVLKEDLENLERLHQATGTLAAILEPRALQERICEEFALLGRASTVIFWLRPSVEEDLLVAARAKGIVLPAEEVRRAFGESVTGRVASRGRAERVDDVAQDPDFHPLPGAPAQGPMIVLPLAIQGRVLGVVSLSGGRATGFSDREEGILVALAEFSAVALQNAENYNRAIRDSLTNLYVKRYFEDRLRGEFSRFRRYGSPLSLLMIDLDRFKSVNDTYGHPVGDKVLIHFAKIVERIIRSGTDVPSRYGGEEFSVILVETDEDGARIVGERLRKAVEEYTFDGPNGRLAVTVSIGASTARTGLPVEELVHEADQALYRAKRGGRNRAFHYQDVGE